MFKVFLVEDERNIRESIRDTIDWSAAGFEYQGDAPDGELALKAIRRLRPDIVVTDVKMPFMDGLELAELIRAELPATRIVILSGHGDFSYAQKAIRLGVVEYLLKPISPADLMRAVNRVAMELRESLAAESGAPASERVAYQKKRNDFLRRLLSGAVAPSEIFARVTELGLPFKENLFLVASLKAGGKAVGLDAEMRMRDELAKLLKPLEAVAFEQGKGECAIVFQGKDEKALFDAARGALGEFIDHCRDALDVLAHAGVGGPTERLHELGRSLRESEIACNYAMFTGAAGPVDFSGMRDEGGAPGLFLAERLKKSEEFFQKGELSELEEFVVGIRRAAAEVGGGIGLQYAYIDLLMTAGRFLKNLRAEPEAVLPELGRLHESAFGVSGPEQFERAVSGICGRVVGYRKKHLAGRYRELLAGAKAFIDENYADPDLSLNAVAMHVHVSPTHFSAIFSREAGETFSDYLSRVRMDNATRLLKTTSLPAAEISRLVGYNDPQYFSRVFKRAVGVSIRSFRVGG